MNLFLQQRACETKDHCLLLLVASTSRRFPLTKTASIANVGSCCSWTHLHFLPWCNHSPSLFSPDCTPENRPEVCPDEQHEVLIWDPIPCHCELKRAEGGTFLPMLFLVLLLQMVIKILTMPWFWHRFFSAEEELKECGQKLFKPNITLDLRKNSVDFSRFFLLARAGNKP